MSHDLRDDQPASITFHPTAFAVREALARARAIWQNSGMEEATCRTAEQVLAEVFNNILEHAQAGRLDGIVRFDTTCATKGVVCRVHDDGREMPNGLLPEGVLADHGCGFDDLPEGGFGWFMIRSMTTELSYTRMDGWNRLEFCIAR